ncbi:MAG: leucyl aminopeptidase [Candidatus Competibacter sp.]|nr:leucyl aminopeptidase [Candidatus Competibacter sp.]MDG4605844.1 leucyl aminopeptidase [Candidatus Contendobacter sp.]HRD49526.1 leucyl aminopeptidase [Candidatus Contendobacter sp.]
MEFVVKSGNPEKQRTACLVLGVYESRRLAPAAEQFDAVYNGVLSTLLRRGDLEGKAGQSLLLFNLADALCERVLLIGCGKERDLDDRRFRQIASHAATALNETGATEAVVYLTDLAVKGRETDWKIRQMVEAVETARYRCDALKSRKDTPRRPLRKIILSVPRRRELPEGEQAVRQGIAIAAGVRLAKDLGNLPPNLCTPTYLAEQAQALAGEFPALRVEVLEEADMERLGMGALLAVSRGSAQPAKLIRLDYRHGAARKPYMLVGKGVTFDTGGISLKPGEGMDEMKYDMCGAASVLGTLRACAELRLPLNVIGLIPAVENMPGGRASRPGDIVTSLSGQTIEILNTDAEGRLILCDALTYAERDEPAAVVDIATLTGACIIALGRHPHGLFSNHPPLAHALQAAGHATCDRVWELPLWEDYQEALDSNFADMANVAGNRDGGAIIAACFLSRFARKFHWAHLDIAGTAWKTGKAKGATGRPVPLLTQYLLDRVAETEREDGRAAH